MRCQSYAQTNINFNEELFPILHTIKLYCQKHSVLCLLNIFLFSGALLIGFRKCCGRCPDCDFHDVL